MENGLSKYPNDMHVGGKMGETQKKSKKCDLDLSCIFDAIECLR
jgi:hypothetical protein